MPGANATEVDRHVGFLGAVYAAGVLLGAPLWGAVSDRVGRGRILIIGLLGYVASLLLLLVPAMATLWGLYALRGTSRFFVAAVVPVVAALVAQHPPETQRARRFAWLGALSLLGFLFGPALSAVAAWVAPWLADSALSPALPPALPPAPSPAVSPAQSARVVLVLSALLGAVMMLGLAATLPASINDDTADSPRRAPASGCRSSPTRRPALRRKGWVS